MNNGGCGILVLYIQLALTNLSNVCIFWSLFTLWRTLVLVVLNRLINVFFSFGFTIEIIHRYALNRLIHGFSVGFTVEIIHGYELNRLIDGFHLSSFLKSFIVMD